MKISIIGRGNAGCLAALYFSHYSSAEVELIYDSKTQPEEVGQASILGLPILLGETLGVTPHDNPFNSTIKAGILYKGWGKKQNEIFHGFSFGSYGIHFDPAQLQDHILNRISSKIKISDRKINSYDEIDSDYIIDCSGFPKDTKNYVTLKNPLNSVLLSSMNEIRNNTYWTEAIATPDGWCFVIPGHESTSLGYLYNSNITSEDSAKKNFKRLQGAGEIDGSFSFSCFMAKDPIKDERVILNGNKLFFLEPLEATAIELYIEWNRMVLDWMNGKASSSQIKKHITETIYEIQNFILWHYHFGSKYNTEFWEYAKKIAIDDPMFYNFIRNSRRKENWASEFNEEYNEEVYGHWGPRSFKLWEDAMKT